MSGRTPTHKVLIYVSGQKTQKVHTLSVSSRTALIPPSRRGSSSADIRVSESSFAEAQFARCAAWSSTYNMSSAMFCRATRTSRFATAHMACRSAAGHNEIQHDDVDLFELYRSPAAPNSQVPSPRWYLLSGQRTLVSPTPPSRRYQRTGDSPTTGRKRYSRPHVRTHSVALHHPLCLQYMIPCTGSPEADSAGSSPSRLTVDMNMNTICVVVINHYECHKLQAFSRIRNYNIAVTEDPESTKKSTAWSPIQPSKNQCPAPEICITGSS